MKKLCIILTLLLLLIPAAGVYASDNGYVNSMNTKKTEETPCQINLKAVMPEGMFNNAYCIIANTETGQNYSFIMLNINGYLDRCYVPEGTYAVFDAGVYERDDLTFDSIPAFKCEADKTTDVEIALTQYATIEAENKLKEEAADERIKQAEAEYYRLKGEQATQQEAIANNTITNSAGIIPSNVPEQNENVIGNGFELVKSDNVPKEIKFNVTGSQTGEYNIVVEIVAPGPLSVAQARYSIDGGETFTDATTLPLTGYLTLKGTGLKAVFTVPKGAELTEGMSFSFYCPNPLTSVQVVYGENNASNINMIVESIDSERRVYDVLAETGAIPYVVIRRTGGLGEAVINISSDGGQTLSDDMYMPEEGILVFEDIGVRLVFSTAYHSMVFYEGDTFSAQAHIEEADKGEGPNLLMILLVIALVIALGYYGFTLYIKSKKPKPGQYRINRYKPE